MDNSISIDVKSKVLHLQGAPSRCLGDLGEAKPGLEAFGEKYVRCPFVFPMSSLVCRLSVATVLAKRPL